MLQTTFGNTIQRPQNNIIHVCFTFQRLAQDVWGYKGHYIGDFIAFLVKTLLKL